MDSLERKVEKVVTFSGFIKGGEFLNQLNDYKLLKKDSDPWS
jgi:hypothetical protein